MRPIRFGEVYEGQDGERRLVTGRSVAVAEQWISYQGEDGVRKSMKIGDWRRLHAGLPDGGLVREEEG